MGIPVLMALRGGIRNVLLFAALMVDVALWSAIPAAAQIPAEPPLAKSDNVQLGEHIPGSFAGMVFKDHYAYVSGWGGITVLDIAQADVAAARRRRSRCRTSRTRTWTSAATRCSSSTTAPTQDFGAVMYVVNIANPSTPTFARPCRSDSPAAAAARVTSPTSSRPTAARRGSTAATTSRSSTSPCRPHRGRSASSRRPPPTSAAFNVSHDTELDSTGTVWNVGGGGAAGYRLTADPLAPQLLGTTGDAGRNPSPYNDFILHNSQRAGTRCS